MRQSEHQLVCHSLPNCLKMLSSNTAAVLWPDRSWHSIDKTLPNPPRWYRHRVLTWQLKFCFEHLLAFHLNWFAFLAVNVAKTHQNWRIFYPVDCDFAIKLTTSRSQRLGIFATLGHLLGRKTVRAKWMLDSGSPIHQSLAVRSDTSGAVNDLPCATQIRSPVTGVKGARLSPILDNNFYHLTLKGFCLELKSNTYSPWVMLFDKHGHPAISWAPTRQSAHTAPTNRCPPIQLCIISACKIKGHKGRIRRLPLCLCVPVKLAGKLIVIGHILLL